MIKTILLAGGTGLIGARLAEILRAKGHSARILTRTPRGENQYGWDPEKGEIDKSVLAGVSAVVNLAGTGVADARWTPARKRAIVSSRVQSAQLLKRVIQESAHKPEVYISASGIGFYGNSGEREIAETDPPASADFLSETCVAWEKAAGEVTETGVPVVIFRIGIVLAREGGAMREMMRPLQFGAGTYFADGRAWYSWIHRDDLCHIMTWAAEGGGWKGKPVAAHVFNAVAPHPARNRDLVEALAAAMHKKALMMPAPAFALRLALGEMAHAVLNSNKVSAEKIQQAGFSFHFPELKGALADIFRR